MENQEVEKVKSSKWEVNLIVLQIICLVLGVAAILGGAWSPTSNSVNQAKFFIYIVLLLPFFSLYLFIKYNYYGGKKYGVFSLILSFFILFLGFVVLSFFNLF